jgi:acetolactate synthase-1/2/3 large subunit
MGFGLPHSIGAYFSTDCKAKRIICIIGDGGLQHNIQELELLNRYKIPIKLIVFNNNGYNSIRHMQNRVFKGHKVGCDEESGLTLPDSNYIANSFELQYELISINEKYHIIEKLHESFKKEDPILIEVLIDDKVEMQPKLTTKVNADGTIVSAPLDDLYPFLPREEFDKIKGGM